MALDGLVINALSQELDHTLTGCRIDKIYQPEKTEFILAIKTSKGSKKLLISCNSDHPGLYFTTQNYENPSTPSALCMFFRKHLQGSRITGVKQYESERIVEILIDSLDELGVMISKKIIVELMGRYSNILLIQDNLEGFPQGKILDSAKRGSLDSNVGRLVLPGQPYEYPPNRDRASYKNLLSTGYLQEIGTPAFSDPIFLSEFFQGISSTVAGQISASENPLETLYTYARDIHSGNYTPTVWISSKNAPKDIHILDLQIYSHLEKREFEDTSSALDFYYLSRSSSNKLEQEKQSLRRSIKNILKKISIKKGKLATEVEQAKDSEHLRIYGELLMANLHLFETGDTTVKVVNYYDNSEVAIPLDIKISPSKNAQLYFKKFAKSKRAVEEKSIQLRKAEDEIAYLESVLTFLEMTGSSDEINSIREELIESEFLRKDKKKTQSRKKSKPTLLTFTSSEGRTILVGRNNKENDYITFNAAGRKDLWFHTKDIPGSHVVLTLNGEEPTKKEILETAGIAAFFSKASTSENIPVDYVSIRNIKKMGNGKPGMVIFTENNTVYVNPFNPENS